MGSVLIKLLKRQIVNDVIAHCSVMARELQRSPETEEKGGDIMNPDDPMTKPIVARAITEGFGEVKRICQRYLIMGRDTDDNRLEQINEMAKTEETVSGGSTGTYDLVANQTYLIKVSEKTTLQTAAGAEIGVVEKDGVFEYTPTSTGKIKFESDADEVDVTYMSGEFGTLELELNMPGNFNLAMTETAKSSSHRMIVDHVMKSLLLNQWPEKASVYMEDFNLNVEGLRNALHARTSFRRNAPDWS